MNSNANQHQIASQLPTTSVTRVVPHQHSPSNSNQNRKLPLLSRLAPHVAVRSRHLNANDPLLQRNWPGPGLDLTAPGLTAASSSIRSNASVNIPETRDFMHSQSLKIQPSLPLSELICSARLTDVGSPPASSCQRCKSAQPLGSRSAMAC